MADLPEYDEELQCTNPVCQFEERTAPITGLHGMAGGGMGPYTVCANCGMILSKSQDPDLCDSHEDDDEDDVHEDDEPPKDTPEYQKWVETKVHQLRGDDDEQATSDDQAVNNAEPDGTSGRE